ncbi:MAG: GNAT family N-acetyltransferase [bacterium]|nr:GNAT family N-acetyltransferase [bacterium]
MKIRRFQETDLSRRLEISNACFPNWTESLESARYQRGTLSNETFIAEFVALEDGTITGCANLRSEERHFVEPGVFGLEAHVHPEHRGKGHGRALLDLLLGHLAYLDWRQVLAGCLDDGGPARGMLERRGFALEQTELCSRLELGNYSPPADHDAALARFHERGYRMATYGGLDDPDKERKLWELYEEIEHDMPGTVEHRKADLAEWREKMGSPARRIEEILLALEGDALVGLTELIFPAGPGGRAVIESTGTRKAHRGRGVATALKYVCADRAKADGVPAINTGNERNNEAILKINRRLGFEPLPPWLGLSKKREGSDAERKESEPTA